MYIATFFLKNWTIYCAELSFHTRQWAQTEDDEEQVVLMEKPKIGDSIFTQRLHVWLVKKTDIVIRVDRQTKVTSVK
jgi:hypothetical protein